MLIKFFFRDVTLAKFEGGGFDVVQNGTDEIEGTSVPDFADPPPLELPKFFKMFSDHD